MATQTNEAVTDRARGALLGLAVGDALGTTLEFSPRDSLPHHDEITGGGGADSFRYQAAAESVNGSADHILDFTPGTDRIELDRIDANTLAAGNQAFTWIGSNAFAGSGAASAGQLRAYQDGNDWFVQGDTNGDGTADLVIQLVVTGGALSQSDFLP